MRKHATDRDDLDNSLGQAERYSAGCSWLRREWWHWFRQQTLTSHGVLPPSPLHRWCHSCYDWGHIGFHKQVLTQPWPTAVDTAHWAISWLTTAVTAGDKFW